MRLKINKACDLSSISVLPPQSRRPNANPSAPDCSVFARSQALQLRSQSQQSFSQGMPLSQLSQNSVEENLANEQRFGSQERENSMKRNSFLAPITYTREESLMPVSRSSNSVTRRWSSAPLLDHKCQVSEELEHRIALVETSLSRVAMVLDSIQSDVMQVNKSVKEVLIGTEAIRQKMILQDNSLQLLIKGDEDTKASLERRMQSILSQTRKEPDQDKFKKIESALTELPHQIRSHLLKLQSELCLTFTKEVENLSGPKSSGKNQRQVTIQVSKGSKRSIVQSSKKQPIVIERPAAPQTCRKRGRKIGTAKLKPSRPMAATSTFKTHYQAPPKQHILKKPEEDWTVIIDSDDEMNGGFSFLVEDKGKGPNTRLIEEVKEETERLLRKARRRKRAGGSPKVII